MFVYALAKGVRLGYLPESFQTNAKRGYAGILDQFIENSPDGLVHLNGTVSVGGLGGNVGAQAGADDRIGHEVGALEPMLVTDGEADRAGRQVGHLRWRRGDRGRADHALVDGHGPALRPDRGELGAELAARGLPAARERALTDGGDQRVELLGFEASAVDGLKTIGLTSEIIQWKLRLFLPVAAEGPTVLGRLTAKHPIVRCLAAAAQVAA